MMNTPLSTNVSSPSKEFWAYHLSGLGVLVTMQILLIFFFAGAREVFEFHVVASVVWAVAYTLAVVVVRFRCHRYHWNKLSSTQLVKRVLLQSLALGMMVAIVMSAVSLPFYWEDLIAFKNLEFPNTSDNQFLFEFLLRNWLNSSLLIVAWSGAYFAITNSRRAASAEISNLQLAHTLKEAQLNNLSSQLNPHFLFNALNNIRFMISENAEDAERMLVTLSEVLRYSLESSSRQTVSLEQELKVIDQYLEIVGVQFEEKLRFSSKIADDLMSVQVPPMMLQTLVENAVKHGIERLPQGGSIELDVRMKNSNLRIAIVNDIPIDQDAASGGTGIGLDNIRQRLSLIYGNKAQFTTAKSKQRFTAEISIGD